jgi:hypothetical protein
VGVNNLPCASDDRRCNFNGKYNSGHDTSDYLVDNYQRTANHNNNNAINYVDHNICANNICGGRRQIINPEKKKGLPPSTSWPSPFSPFVFVRPNLFLFKHSILYS